MTCPKILINPKTKVVELPSKALNGPTKKKRKEKGKKVQKEYEKGFEVL